MEKRPHAIVFPFPAQGHIIPMMHLSCRLESLGFFITFVNTQRNHLRILQSWRQRRTALPQDRGLHVNMVGLPDDAIPSFSTASVLEAMLITHRLRGAFEELIAKLLKSQPSPPVCIIADGFMSWTQDVARCFKIPWAVFWASSAATSLVSAFIPALMDKGFAPLRGGNEQAAIEFIPGLPAISGSDLPTNITREDRYDPGFKQRIDRIQRVKRADWVLANTFDALEHNEIRAMQGQVVSKFLPVGPVLPLQFLGIEDDSVDLEISTEEVMEDNHCFDWLDRHSAFAVVLVAFGSAAHLTPRQLEQIAFGLKDSGFPFLWLLSSDLVQGLPPDVRTSFSNSVKERGKIIPWAPLLRVLKHQAVGAFVTHCGWNSILEGVSVGVPMICWPCHADQMLNCRYIVKEWRIGLELEKDVNGLVSKEEVDRVVRNLMEGQDGRQIRRRIDHLKAAAREAMVETGLSRKNFEAFARAMKEEMISSSFF